MSSLLMPEMLIISPWLYRLALCTIDFHPFLLIQTSRSSGYYCVQSQFSSGLTELLLTRYHQQSITTLLLLVTGFNQIDPQNKSLRKSSGNPEGCSQVSLERHHVHLLEFICIFSDIAVWFVVANLLPSSGFPCRQCVLYINT